MSDENEIMIATRVSKKLYARILKRQREAEKLTGVAPSISALARAMIEEASCSPKRRSTANERAA